MIIGEDGVAGLHHAHHLGVDITGAPWRAALRGISLSALNGLCGADGVDGALFSADDAGFLDVPSDPLVEVAVLDRDDFLGAGVDGGTGSQQHGQQQAVDVGSSHCGVFKIGLL